jgi:hypothetical protein
MIVISLPILFDSKGQNPKSIRNNTTPKDQISALIVYYSPLRIYGAIYIGDPSIV